MTVAELIAKLQQLPQDAVVEYAEEGAGTFREVAFCKEHNLVVLDDDVTPNRELSGGWRIV